MLDIVLLLITSSMTRHDSVHLTHTLATTRHSACADVISDLTHRPTGAQLAECSRVAVSTDSIAIAPEHFAEVVDIWKPVAITCTAHHLLSPSRSSTAPTLAFKQRESPAVLCSCSGTRTTLA